MDKMKIISGILLGLAAGAVSVQADIIALYNFQDQTLNNSAVASDVTVTTLSLGAGLNQDTTETIVTGGNAFVNALDSGDAYSLGGTSSSDGLGFVDMNNQDSLGWSINQNDYLEFALTADVDDVDLTSLTFQFKANTIKNAAERYAIFTSTDGFSSAPEAADAITTYQMLTFGSYELQTIDLSGVADITALSTTTFRIYVYGGDAPSSGFTGFDDITLNGVVPEPAVIGLIGIGGLLTLLVNRFKRR